MSLTLIQSADPALTYLAHPATFPSFIYHEAELVSDGGQFQESIALVEGFYYDISRDRYVVIALMDQIFWPSWKYTRFDIDPETGLQTGRQDFGGGAIGFSWTRGYQNSDWKKVYAHRIFNPTNYIVEVRPTIPEPTSVQLANPIVTDADVGGLGLNYFTLNREQNIVAFSNGVDSNLNRFNYSTQTNLGAMKLPEGNVSDFATESNELVWVLQKDSGGSGFVVSKVNFIDKKYELYSKVPAATSGTDISASIAFDTLRKSVAVFRHRADSSVDGSAQHVVDIYKPIVLTDTLTAPVPVTELKPNKRATLVAHLLDQKGTGAGGKTVKVTKTNPDANLKQSTTSVRGNGSIVIPYDTPNPNATDTITLQVTT